MIRRIRFGLACLAVAASLTPVVAQARPNFVDLIAYQTPIRNQGAQGSCIVFAATAALEAAYAHAQYGKIDLSEALLNHFGKMMWIEPRWKDTLSKGEDGDSTAPALRRLTAGVCAPLTPDCVIVKGSPHIGKSSAG